MNIFLRLPQIIFRWVSLSLSKILNMSLSNSMLKIFGDERERVEIFLGNFEIYTESQSMVFLINIEDSCRGRG